MISKAKQKITRMAELSFVVDDGSTLSRYVGPNYAEIKVRSTDFSLSSDWVIIPMLLPYHKALTAAKQQCATH